MICRLKVSTDEFIDLSKPVQRAISTFSVYPFGFVVESDISDRSRKPPDRCEYLLTQVIDPKPLQDFLTNCHNTHPELFI
jgi:hypothetical protein